MDVVFDLDSVTLSDAGVRLAKLRPEIAYSTGGRLQRWRPSLSAELGRMVVRSPDRKLALSLEIEKSDETVIIRTALRNESNGTVEMHSLAPLASTGAGDCRIGSDASRWSVFRQGYQSWTGTRSFRAVDTDLDPYPHALAVTLIDVDNPSPGQAGQFRSDLFTAIRHLDTRECIVIGFLSGKEAFGGIEVRIEGSRCTRLAAVLDYDGVTLASGMEMVGPPLWLAAGRDEHELISAYANAVGQEMEARVPAKNPVGWCSWYYYFTGITEERILDNLEALGDLRERFACDYVQVDDGYQSEIGDWLTPNGKFPRGMAWLAEQIRSAGFEAGIWTAPFIARHSSRLMTEHPDWFVRNERGRPRFAIWNPVWGLFGNCYALDTTHPGVLDWLRSTFRTIVEEWGYHVLKLDFLYAAALPGRRHDPSATRAQALRRGLEAIREGAGEKAFLLGCGCPQAPAIGVVDAMRIGPDVAPWWSSWMARGPQRDSHGLATKHAIRNTLTRAFSHRRWWLNDPDCLMVRDTKTRLGEEEVRSLATAIAITDGMLVLSDRVDRISESRLKLLDRARGLAGGAAAVVDLMESDIPELVVSQSVDETVVAVFNFADTAQDRSLDLDKLGISANPDDQILEWWTGAALSMVAGRIGLGTIPPHGCRVLRLPVVR